MRDANVGQNYKQVIASNYKDNIGQLSIFITHTR